MREADGKGESLPPLLSISADSLSTPSHDDSVSSFLLLTIQIYVRHIPSFFGFVDFGHNTGRHVIVYMALGLGLAQYWPEHIMLKNLMIIPFLYLMLL